MILLALHGARYSGLGTNLITASFTGDTIYRYDWILKLLLTIATLAIGFQGGEVTPLFSIGASLGVVLGSAFGISPVICASLGYAAVFGSATNTVIAPILIGPGSLWKPECDPFGCGLPAGIYGQWKSFNLWGTGEGAV